MLVEDSNVAKFMTTISAARFQVGVSLRHIPFPSLQVREPIRTKVSISPMEMCSHPPGQWYHNTLPFHF